MSCTFTVWKSDFHCCRHSWNKSQNNLIQILLPRYPRDFIVEGTPYAGFDRHNGEIAAFHLDRWIADQILCKFIFSDGSLRSPAGCTATLKSLVLIFLAKFQLVTSVFFQLAGSWLLFRFWSRSLVCLQLLGITFFPIHVCTTPSGYWLVSLVTGA